MQFWNFLVVRLLQAVVVIVIVVSLVFLVSRLVGNPEQFLAGPDATEETSPSSRNASASTTR